MILITGDTHGNQKEWMEEIAPVLSASDTMIVCGDFGVGFWDGDFSEAAFYDFLHEQAYTVLFIDGNHENFDQLNRYPISTWCGGKVHKIRDNVIHLMRGEVYRIEGKTVFVMGGGHSMDRYRRTEGVSWWPQEMPSEEEYRRALANLEKAGRSVDYIITHTSPAETVYYLSTLRSLGIRNDAVEEHPLTYFLDEIQRTVPYKRWYFGHFHVDMELWRNQTALIHSIRELTTGEIIRDREPFAE